MQTIGSNPGNTRLEATFASKFPRRFSLPPLSWGSLGMDTERDITPITQDQLLAMRRDELSRIDAKIEVLKEKRS